MISAIKQKQDDPRCQPGAAVKIPNGSRAFVTGTKGDRVAVNYEAKHLGTDLFPLHMLTLVEASLEPVREGEALAGWKVGDRVTPAHAPAEIESSRAIAPNPIKVAWEAISHDGTASVGDLHELLNCPKHFFVDLLLEAANEPGICFDFYKGKSRKIQERLPQDIQGRYIQGVSFNQHSSNPEAPNCSLCQNHEPVEAAEGASLKCSIGKMLGVIAAGGCIAEITAQNCDAYSPETETFEVSQEQLEKFAKQYSGESLTRNKIKGVVQWGDREWVVTSVSSEALKTFEVSAVQILEKSQWHGATYAYETLPRNEKGCIDRRGHQVTYKGRDLVLTNIPAKFVAAQSSLSIQNSSLIATAQTLWAEIDQAIAVADQAQYSALDSARLCGETLLQLKAETPHGQWETVRNQIVHPRTGKPMPSQTATLYQRISEKWETLQAEKVRGIKQADEALRRLKPAKEQPESKSPTVGENAPSPYEYTGIDPKPVWFLDGGGWIEGKAVAQNDRGWVQVLWGEGKESSIPPIKLSWSNPNASHESTDSGLLRTLKGMAEDYSAKIFADLSKLQEDPKNELFEIEEELETAIAKILEFHFL